MPKCIWWRALNEEEDAAEGRQDSQADGDEIQKPNPTSYSPHQSHYKNRDGHFGQAETYEGDGLRNDAQIDCPRDLLRLQVVYMSSEPRICSRG